VHGDILLDKQKVPPIWIEASTSGSEAETCGRQARKSITFELNVLLWRAPTLLGGRSEAEHSKIGLGVVRQAEVGSEAEHSRIFGEVALGGVFRSRDYSSSSGGRNGIGSCGGGSSCCGSGSSSCSSSSSSSNSSSISIFAVVVVVVVVVVTVVSEVILVDNGGCVHPDKARCHEDYFASPRLRLGLFHQPARASDGMIAI